MRHHSKSFNWNQENSRTIILTKILPFWDLKLAIYVHIGKSIYFNSLLGVIIRNMSNQNISDLCCKIGLDTINIQTLVYNLTTRWRLSWVVSYVEWQALNEVNDLEFWKKIQKFSHFWRWTSHLRHLTKLLIDVVLVWFSRFFHYR